MIEVRLFAAARDAAGGEARVEVEAADVATVVAVLADRFGPRMAEVLALSTLVSDGVRLCSADSLASDATVDVLPPFAGG